MPAPTLKSNIAQELRALIQLGSATPDDAASLVRVLQNRFGQVEPGDVLPSIRELKDHYNVARDTVRDAIGVLSREGLVVPKRGIGTVVRDTTPVLMHYSPDKPSRT